MCLANTNFDYLSGEPVSLGGGEEGMRRGSFAMILSFHLTVCPLFDPSLITDGDLQTTYQSIVREAAAEDINPTTPQISDP
ncbi:hypothetical protein E2C01_044513 [Portunus trituberculatus]|uniref:Uncharacterized protein n=1 Tax=Portunus trituberculatus TaxID=210409 RepID=A0A5B7G2J5_PORTR|nr:hypothetical protein [Portunus trituberculatus]